MGRDTFAAWGRVGGAGQRFTASRSTRVPAALPRSARWARRHEADRDSDRTPEVPRGHRGWGALLGQFGDGAVARFFDQARFTQRASVDGVDRLLLAAQQLGGSGRLAGLEHALPISPFYEDVVKLGAASGLTYTPTLIVASHITSAISV